MIAENVVEPAGRVPWDKRAAADHGRRSVERPHQPFVFRSVLDGRPRVVTIALS